MKLTTLLFTTLASLAISAPTQAPSTLFQTPAISRRSALTGRDIGHPNEVFYLTTCTFDGQNRFGVNYTLHLGEVHYYQDRATTVYGRQSDAGVALEFANEYTYWYRPVHPFHGVSWVGTFNQGAPTTHGWLGAALWDPYLMSKDNFAGPAWFVDGDTWSWQDLDKYSFYFCFRDDGKEMWDVRTTAGRHRCKKEIYCIPAKGKSGQK